MNPTFQLTFDSADPERLARFWIEILGYRFEDPPEGFETWRDWLVDAGIPEERWNDAAVIVDPDGARPRIFIQRVPEPKTAKNRMHLDVNAGGPRGTPPEERARALEEAVARAVSLGATKLYEKDEYGTHWVTLADPDGNEFCMQ